MFVLSSVIAFPQQLLVALPTGLLCKLFNPTKFLLLIILTRGLNLKLHGNWDKYASSKAILERLTIKPKSLNLSKASVEIFCTSFKLSAYNIKVKWWSPKHTLPLTNSSFANNKASCWLIPSSSVERNCFNCRPINVNASVFGTIEKDWVRI